MNLNDQPKLGEMLEEVCAIYSKPYNDVLTHAYYRVLKTQSFDAVSKATMRLLTDSSRRQVMPTAAEIKAIAEHMEPRGNTRGSLDEERWRRRYDVWQHGRYSDEALEVAFTLSDDELGVGQEQGHAKQYLACQQPMCTGLIIWPPDRQDIGRMFCPQHQPDQGQSATESDKLRVLQQTTPRARAFLRTVLDKLMAMIPVSAEERTAAEEQASLKRPVAFEHTAEGPGVNPGVFLNRPFLDGMPSDYADRRQLVSVYGWKFDPGKGSWHKGKRVLTDEQVDSLGDKGLLADFLGRR